MSAEADNPPVNRGSSVMNEITGGELLAQSLRAHGIEMVFGLPCPEIDPFLAQLSAYGLRLVPIRHEAAAVHMAEGLYKTTGKVAAVLGNPGPGSANLLPGAVTALHEGVPVLLITSQHRLGIVYPSTPSTFQGQDQLDLFRPAVKWNGPIFEWSRIPEVVRLAFREMHNGRPGPVHLDLPAPVVYESGDPSTAPVWPAEESRAGLPQPSDRQLDEAATLLSGAARPVIIAGTGAERAGARDSVLRLAKLLSCPAIPSMAGRGAVPADDPHYVFGFGPAGDLARREADVILVVGSRMGNLDVPYDNYWGDPAGTRLIQIDIDPRDIAVSRPVHLGIIADAMSAVDGIVARLQSADLGVRDGADLARYRALDEQVRMQMAEAILQWQGPGIHPAHALATVAAVFGPDAVYTVDGGNTSLWAASMLPPTQANSYHSILELGMLGTGIPSAIGAKLGAPDRDVVCVTGDGAAGFNFMELQTAAREGVDVTVVVFAEGSWTMEELNELQLYGTTFGTKQGEIRWDTVAQGLGCAGSYVDSIEGLEPALRAARDHAGPAVVCVRTDHDANLAVPAEMVGRFFEVYSGPAKPAD